MQSPSKHLTWAWRIAAALFFALAAPSAMAAIGTIVGSRHDFTANGGTYKGTNNTAGQVCIYCHAPHNNKSAAGELLWNRALSTATYTPYSSPTMNGAPVAAVGPISKVCLSCHDGTIAIDSFGTFTGSTPISGTSTAKIGPDLSNDHPISFTYNATLASTDGALKDPATANVTIGTGNTGLIKDKMLFGAAGDQLECASCHDVHNTTAKTAVESKLVKVSTASSALCLACHNK